MEYYTVGWILIDLKTCYIHNFNIKLENKQNQQTMKVLFARTSVSKFLYSSFPLAAWLPAIQRVHKRRSQIMMMMQKRRACGMRRSDYLDYLVHKMHFTVCCRILLHSGRRLGATAPRGKWCSNRNNKECSHLFTVSKVFIRTVRTYFPLVNLGEYIKMNIIETSNCQLNFIVIVKKKKSIFIFSKWY